MASTVEVDTHSRQPQVQLATGSGQVDQNIGVPERCDGDDY